MTDGKIAALKELRGTHKAESHTRGPVAFLVCVFLVGLTVFALISKAVGDILPVWTSPFIILALPTLYLFLRWRERESQLVSVEFRECDFVVVYQGTRRRVVAYNSIVETREGAEGTYYVVHRTPAGEQQTTELCRLSDGAHVRFVALLQEAGVPYRIRTPEAPC